MDLGFVFCLEQMNKKRNHISQENEDRKNKAKLNFYLFACYGISFMWFLYWNHQRTELFEMIFEEIRFDFRNGKYQPDKNGLDGQTCQKEDQN